MLRTGVAQLPGLSLCLAAVTLSNLAFVCLSPGLHSAPSQWCPVPPRKCWLLPAVGYAPPPTLCLEGKQMGELVQARILHFFFLSCPYPVSLRGRLATCCHPVIPEVLRAERQAWLHWWLGGGCVKGRAELPSHLDSEPWLLDKGSELLLGL